MHFVTIECCLMNDAWKKKCLHIALVIRSLLMLLLFCYLILGQRLHLQQINKKMHWLWHWHWHWHRSSDSHHAYGYNVNGQCKIHKQTHKHTHRECSERVLVNGRFSNLFAEQPTDFQWIISAVWISLTENGFAIKRLVPFFTRVNGAFFSVPMLYIKLDNSPIYNGSFGWLVGRSIGETKSNTYYRTKHNCGRLKFKKEKKIPMR